MRTVLRATAMLSASSIVAVGVSVLAGKGRAVLIGPDGLGLLVLLQSVVMLAIMAGGFGIGPGLVRLAAGPARAGNAQEVAAVRRAAWLLRLGLGIVMVILLIALRDPVSRLFLGGSQYSGSLLVVVAALVFGLAYDLEVSILTAHQRTASVAKWWVLNSVLGAMASLSLLFLLRSSGVPLSIVAGAFVGWLLAAIFVRAAVRVARTPVDPAQLRQALGRLLKFGGPYTASQLVGGGVVLIIPAMTLAVLGRVNVGFYQAAFAVANNYLGFLASAMSSDYYPRLSAAGSDRTTISQLINQQQRLVYIVALPVILAALAFCPYFVPVIYTSAFGPSVNVLEWMLLGDLFLFSSWTISFAILARSSSVVYFGIELFGGLAHLVTAWLGLHWFGLPGLGVSWLVSNVAYLAVVYVIARRSFGLRWTPQNLALLGAAAMAMVVARLAISSGVETIRLATLLILLAAVLVFSLRALRQEYGADWRRQALSKLRAEFGGGAVP